jgi:hypothetical protein
MCREFKNSLNLRAGHAEFFDQFVNAHILKVLKDCCYGHAGTLENPRSATPSGNAFDGGAL